MKNLKSSPSTDASIGYKALQRAEVEVSVRFRFWQPGFPIVMLLMMALLVSACGLKPNKERLQYEIEELESEVSILYRDTGKSETTLSKSVILRDAYLKYADSWRSDSLTAEYLFQAAMIDADIQNDVSTGIKFLERIVDDFPDHPIRSKTLFLVGFTYAEQLHNYSKAQEAYQQYLDEYPDGEMASSVRIEIETLGHTPIIPINPDSATANPDQTPEQP